MARLCYRQIDLSVLIEISRNDRRERAQRNIEIRKRVKYTPSLAQQNAYRSICVCQSQVGAAVVVEVCHCERRRRLGQGVQDGLGQVSISVVEQNGKEFPGGSGNSHIGLSVAVEIA